MSISYPYAAETGILQEFQVNYNTTDAHSIDDTW